MGHGSPAVNAKDANNPQAWVVEPSMRKRWACITVGGGALALAGWATLWNFRTPLPTVRFADGRTTRVLKVSFGTNHVFSTEPVWKQASRRILPERWEGWLGSTRIVKRRTEFDSIAIFFEPVPPPPGNRSWTITVETLFSDGTKFRGTRWGPSSGYPLVLQNYARGDKEIIIRLCDGDHAIRIKVPNPHPVPKAVWQGRSLAQTNCVGGRQVILKGYRGAAQPYLVGRAPNGTPIGWMQWRTTWFDPWGNWNVSVFPGEAKEKVFKLLAEGTEYISAGFVETPGQGQYQILSP
ncbi:MAG TPA: hypothetical protein VJ063_08830, partial [Verrucomicrobiae bacterium]|nr:hypothetical protein [Verrucomicrobiae bacterium]